MGIIRKTILASAVGLCMVGGVEAHPIFGTGLNSLFFNNFENGYRSTARCTAEGGCLAANAANDPTGYQRLDPTVAGNVKVGDILLGILNVQNIDNNGTTIWAQNLGIGSADVDQFGGYFGQEVKGVLANPHGLDLGAPVGPDFGVHHLILGSLSVADPFGVLDVNGADNLFGTSDDEMFRAFVDHTDAANPSKNTAFESNGTTFDDIAKATDGDLWASMGGGLTGFPLGVGPPSSYICAVFGFDCDLDGYAYTHTDLGVALNGSEPSTFLALNLLTLGPAYNAGALAKINDVNENEVGGVNPSPTTAPCLVGGITCTDVVGTGEIELNPGFANGSPWVLRSNDPLEIYVIPEPGSLALVGMSLVALGARRRKGHINNN